MTPFIWSFDQLLKKKISAALMLFNAMLSLNRNSGSFNQLMYQSRQIISPSRDEKCLQDRSNMLIVHIVPACNHAAVTKMSFYRTLTLFRTICRHIIASAKWLICDWLGRGGEEYSIGGMLHIAQVFFIASKNDS